MDNSQKQSNKAKKKRGNRRNRKKMQPAHKAPSAASGGGEGACSRKSSGGMRAGGADDASRPDETASHLLKRSTKPALLQEPAVDPTSAVTVQQITGHVASKIAVPAQAFDPCQDVSSAATELPPCRPLHSCPIPWRPGEKTAPVQLKNGANSTETHHRTILAILNRITDTKMELLLNRSISLILPLHSNDNSFLNNGQPKATACGESMPLVEPKSSSNRGHPGNGTDLRGTSKEDRSKLVANGMVSEATNRVDGSRVGTDTCGPSTGQLNIKGIRKDFVSMLLEKAQEEEMYTREYSWFLRGLCAAIEVEADCAQLALERVQERWGEAVLLESELVKKVHPKRKSGKEVLTCDETPTTGKGESIQRPKNGAGVRDDTEGTVNESRNSRRGKRKGTLSTDVQGEGKDGILISREVRSDCPLQGLEHGQPFIDSESKSTMTPQSFQGIELGESVVNIAEDNTFDTRSTNTNNDKAFCDTSSFCEFIPSEAELDSFLRNSSLKKGSCQISCCGAYGDLSRFRTVIRHRALFRELFTQGPSFRELVSTEALLRFNVLYGSLRQLYAGHTPWDEDEEMHVRRRLKNHLRLMVLLHLSTLLPLASLELVRNTLAGPLENPAAAGPFAGGLAWGAPNLPLGGGVMPPQPPQNAQEGVDGDDQNLLVVANLFQQADGAVQLPQLEHPHEVAAEGLQQEENAPFVEGIPFEGDDAPADIAQINNYNNVASNNLNVVVAANNDLGNANFNHIDIINDANVNGVNNLNNVDVNNLDNDNLNNVINVNNVNNANNNVNNDNNINGNLNNVNNINNLNNLNNMNTSGASLLGMSAELLSFYLTTAGHINLRDRARTDEVCDLLQHTLPHLSSRQTFLVVTVLELQQRGWTEVKAPDRSG